MKNVEMIVEKGYDLKDLDIAFNRTEKKNGVLYDRFDILIKQTKVSEIRVKRPDGIKEDADFVDYADRQLMRWLDHEQGNILDKAERRYLRSYSKPFRNSVDAVAKVGGSKRESIMVQINGEPSIPFPAFEAGTMYKGMQKYRWYTPDELKI